MDQRKENDLVFERRILDNLGSAVLLFDEQLRLLYVNPASETLFDLSARNMLGRPASELIHGPDDTLQHCLERVRDTEQPYIQRGLQLFLPPTRKVTVDCSVVPLRLMGGGKQILIELQQLDRQLRITYEEHLMSQHDATRSLVRGLAHEIKNPLGGLRGAAQLLEQELADASLHEYTQVIIAEADRLQALLDRMLGPNRLPRTEQVNIHQVLERVRQLVQAEVGGGVLLERDYDPSIPTIRADSDQLIQAVLNIVRNAVKALQGSGRICLRSRVERQYTIGNRRHRLVMVVEIIDNGPGIPDKLREQIFYPLVTGGEGIGLGLSISQSLVNQIGGLIECRSQPGETVFTLLLPLEQDND